MRYISVPINITSNKIVIRDDFKEYFKEFREKNNNTEAILEVSIYDDKKNDLNTYYKVDVLPSVMELLKKDNLILSLEEVDFMLRSLFWTRIEKVPNISSLFVAKRFESLGEIEKLNVLSSINIWVTKKYMVQLPKIRK